jgi:hypothetical protein
MALARYCIDALNLEGYSTSLDADPIRRWPSGNHNSRAYILVLGRSVKFANERPTMSDNRESDDERPCLHCLIGDVIDDFYAEYGTLSGETDAIDVDEVISALAKTVAELTFNSDAAQRQQLLDDLTRDISTFETEFRESYAAGGARPHVRH